MLPSYTVATLIFRQSHPLCKLEEIKVSLNDCSIAHCYHDFVDTAGVLDHIAVPVAVPVMAGPLAYRLYMLLPPHNSPLFPLQVIVHALGPTSCVGSGVGAAVWA
jgi:hypothetical protein